MSGFEAALIFRNAVSRRFRMNTGPANAPSHTEENSMHSIRASRSGLLVAALTVTAAQAMAAPDAAAILKKSQLAMKNVNSYQATWLMTMDMGQAGSMAMNMDMKMKPKQKMMSMKMTPTGTPTGQMAMAAGMMNMSM